MKAMIHHRKNDRMKAMRKFQAAILLLGSLNAATMTAQSSQDDTIVPSTTHLGTDFGNGDVVLGSLGADAGNGDIVLRSLGADSEDLFSSATFSVSRGSASAVTDTIVPTPADRGKKDWGNIDYKGEPWVKNHSKPSTPTKGLYNTHLALWASHGRYYDQTKARWKWQRPNLFCTTEDLFTQTIVVPYLIPMLENAGANVFTPRERDWQKEEIIVDNDRQQVAASNGQPTYQETVEKNPWTTTTLPGFAAHDGNYADGENPFVAGTARMTTATSRRKVSTISYQPDFRKAGRYAVYVSYQTLPNSVDDAQYIVCHKGQNTYFTVNQQMGGGTWVYLGTFDFEAGCSPRNCVVLTNSSSNRGVVTADAVRFGGGMGNIVRGGTVSGVPRCLEGARYYAQWAGAPRDVVSINRGSHDYNDDINVRSLMTNWLGGGSCYMPEETGKHVPIELSVAVHSDAGINRENGFVGTLSICTTNNEERFVYGSGLSRDASREFAQMMLDNMVNDLANKYKINWPKRGLWDRNYNETRRPAVPAVILEMLSHQNFKDMTYALDPNFRFTMARSIYKTILRFSAEKHGRAYVVQPLQPSNFRVAFSSKGKVTLNWAAVNDPQEPSAKPSAYNVYVAIGSNDFDNGRQVSGTSYNMELEPGIHYRFRVTAVNKGGESFPTEVLSAVYQPGAKKTVMIVNGFHRLSAPAIVRTSTEQGFNLDADPGVSYGPTAGWNGRQQCFDSSQAGKEGPGALGYGEDELVGKFIAGNDFNYVATHADAIRSAQKYNIVSCSSEAVESGRVTLKGYACVDLILGLERDDGHSLIMYKAFTKAMQQHLADYAQKGGSLLVSGSYIGADMTELEEQHFLADVLKVRYGGAYREADNSVNGLGMKFNFFHALNEEHYAATAPDILQSAPGGFCSMQYGNGFSACVAYQGKDYHAMTMGFPFECITDAKTRASIMRGIMNFLVR